MLLNFIFGCLPKAPIQDSNLKPIAEETMNVAHPTAELLEYTILVTENSTAKGRYSDVQMRYKPVLQAPAVLTVRYFVLSTDPCRVDVNLLSDTGLIPPLLLNEWASESSISALVCQLQ